MLADARQGAFMAGFSNFADFDAVGLAGLVRKGETNPTELLDAAIERLESVEPKLNAVPIRHADFARRQIADGLPDGPLRGVPFLLKNITALEGTQTDYGSRAFEGFIADHSSTLAQRYIDAGLTIFGKTNTPEFGLSFTTEPALHGPTRNPWNPTHSTGGSSGGAAAIVAARVLPAAHATDGGGSVRVPAACCGVFGLKPTRARTPMGPDRLEGWSGMSHAHVITLSVRDSAALLDATHGPEPGSPYAAPAPERPFLDEVAREPGRLRIGFWDRRPDGAAIDAEVAAAVRDVAALLEKLGHRVEEAAPPAIPEAGAASRAIIAAQTALNLRKREAERGRPIGADEIEFITAAIRDIGLKMNGADHAAAIDAMHQVGRRLAPLGQRFDALLWPTTCLPPIELGRLNMNSPDIEAYVALIARFVPGTSLFNMTGQPSMSVPLAWTRSGLPLGMMFSGRFGGEGMLFRLAAQLEQARPWRDKKPPVCA
jgi:amidase/6-aminohexanoate-cyclic-dimer hydrolase